MSMFDQYVLTFSEHDSVVLTKALTLLAMASQAEMQILQAQDPELSHAVIDYNSATDLLTRINKGNRNVRVNVA